MTRARLALLLTPLSALAVLIGIGICAVEDAIRAARENT